MNTPPLSPSDYARAVQIPGLAQERSQQLVAHIRRSNEALSERPPIPLAVARCAAVLLAADPDRLSCPTALAQASALAQSPRIGPALMYLHEGLMQMDGLSEADVAGLGTHCHAFRRSLLHVAQKVTDILRLLDSG